ncbi:hypothetical protein [Tenacibaculum phage Larrie]|nr:hypothetical protein [Tenacibaculum phage Larrie]
MEKVTLLITKEDFKSSVEIGVNPIITAFKKQKLENSNLKNVTIDSITSSSIFFRVNGKHYHVSIDESVNKNSFYIHTYAKFTDRQCNKNALKVFRSKEFSFIADFIDNKLAVSRKRTFDAIEFEFNIPIE